MMTDQELFDTVATHLFTQGRQAKHRDSCLYRGPDGTKCAVGCLIPDHLYLPEMENQPALYLRYRGYNVPWTEDQDHLVSALQNVHDNWTDLHAALAEVATEFGLTTDNIKHLRLPK